jgi:hypothetical protein
LSQHYSCHLLYSLLTFLATLKYPVHPLFLHTLLSLSYTLLYFYSYYLILLNSILLSFLLQLSSLLYQLLHFPLSFYIAPSYLTNFLSECYPYHFPSIIKYPVNCLFLHLLLHSFSPFDSSHYSYHSLSCLITFLSTLKYPVHPLFLQSFPSCPLSIITPSLFFIHPALQLFTLILYTYRLFSYTIYFSK